MNIENINQRQFDKTMLKEGISVTDYYDSTKIYEVFFRRNNRSRNPQGKLNVFYAQDTGIGIGTLFILKGKTYVVISQDADESNAYFTSLATVCDSVFHVYSGSGNKYIPIPFTVATEKFTVAESSSISIINGMVMIYTGLNDTVKNMKIGNKYKNFGGTYEVKNFFFNNNLAYFYLTREADSADQYVLTYDGATTLSLADGTYQLAYTATKNGEVISNPTIGYVSSNPDIATVSDAGLLTMVTKGSTTITATWTEGEVSCDTTLTISDGATPPTPSGDITATITGNPELKLGLPRVYTVTFKDENGADVTNVDFTWNVVSDFTVLQEVNGNTITLCVEDENAIAEAFLLQVLIDDTVSTEFEITVIDMF